MIKILCKNKQTNVSFLLYSIFSFCFFSVPNWKDVSATTTNLGQNQLLLTVKNSIEINNTKPMTYSCPNTAVNLYY